MKKNAQMRSRTLTITKPRALIDGLPAEFYRFFWPDICHDLLASYNFASEHGMLSISQRRGIISLIPQKSKDKTILENLRSISLLNVDYKILTKVIAKRIEKVDLANINKP